MARRDIAMLGVVHRAVLGKGPAHFKTFFHETAETRRTYLTRKAARRHSRQLHDWKDGRRTSARPR